MTRKNTKKKCDLCETLIRGGQICSACNISYIHFKCVDNLIKYTRINDRKQWICKTCLPALLDETEENIEEQNNIIQSQEQDTNHLEGPLITLEMPAYTTYPEIPENVAIMEPIVEKEYIEVKHIMQGKSLVEFPVPIEMEYQSRKFTVTRSEYQRLIFYDARIFETETMEQTADRILKESNIPYGSLPIHRIFRIIRAVKKKDAPFGDGYDILVECDICVFSQFLDKRDILQSMYKISESVDVVTCKNCRFFYRAKDLRMPVICYWCTGDHTPQDCPVIDPICSNCKC